MFLLLFLFSLLLLLLETLMTQMCVLMQQHEDIELCVRSASATRIANCIASIVLDAWRCNGSCDSIWSMARVQNID